MSRPDREAWHLEGAAWLAQMGDCTRRQVGALIVGPDKRFWGMGYNGSYPGGPSCLEGACPRGRHYRERKVKRRWDNDGTGDGEWTSYWVHECACGEPWPCPDAVAPGSAYDTGDGACIASHAEANAVTDALRRSGGDLDGCTMYVSTEPCDGCVRHIRNSTRIQLIRWPGGVVALP